MTETRCAYADNRDDVLVAYLYDDISPGDRAAFDAHLAACGRCRAELAALRGVRAQLTHWAPPEPVAVSRAVDVPWWRTMPVWAQVAAAMLVVGVAAGAANL